MLLAEYVGNLFFARVGEPDDDDPAWVDLLFLYHEDGIVIIR